MAKVSTKAAPVPATASDGHAGIPGDAGPGNSGAAAVQTPPVLSQENFRHIGETLNGTHWQSDLARDIGISKSQVTRYLDTSGNPRTSRPIPASLGAELQYLINNRMLELALLLDLPGMPWAGTDQAANAKEQMAKALKKVPGAKPARYSADDGA